MLNFLGIGAQKAGTTWLYENLRRHPQIAFPAGKEIHFWNDRKNRSITWYRDLFAAENRLNGEITPAYALLPASVVQEIRDHFPRLRIIYLIRNPIERAWSSAKMALARAEMTMDEASDQWFIDHFRSRGSLARGDYAACIRVWRQIFPAEQLMIERFEAIRDDPVELLRRCITHLGGAVPPFSAEEVAQINTPVFAGSPQPIRPSLWPLLLELYRQPIASLGHYLNEDFSAWSDPQQESASSAPQES